MTLIQKIHEVQKALQKIAKGGTNNFNNYKYARLGDILDPLRPHLFEHGLVVTQSFESQSVEVDYNDKGYYSRAYVTCITTVHDSTDNSTYSVKTIGFAMDKNSDKAVYKAMTGARKYGLTSLFCLDWDAQEPEDDSDEVPVAKAYTTTTTTKRKVF